MFTFTVNDCVVVADFIRTERSTRRPANSLQLKAVVNEALGRVLIRSLLTLAMLIVCSLCMVYMGAEPLHAFSLAITFGIVSAAYTTILLVAPMYYGLGAAAYELRGWWNGEPRQAVDFHLPPVVAKGDDHVFPATADELEDADSAGDGSTKAGMAEPVTTV